MGVGLRWEWLTQLVFHWNNMESVGWVDLCPTPEYGPNAIRISKYTYILWYHLILKWSSDSHKLMTYRCVKLWNNPDTSQSGILYNLLDIILGIDMVCIVSTLTIEEKTLHHCLLLCFTFNKWIVCATTHLC